MGRESGMENLCEGERETHRHTDTQREEGEVWSSVTLGDPCYMPNGAISGYPPEQTVAVVSAFLYQMELA
jgi:hypothetical protein